MSNLFTPLPIAIRLFSKLAKKGDKKGRSKHWRLPEAMLVFDTETRTDTTQRLTFGSYRFYDREQCIEEALFSADDLPVRDWKILSEYAGSHRAAVAGSPQLRLLTLTEFMDRFYRLAYKSRVLVVGFNMPFDMSRVARDATAARGRFAGGFSLGLWVYRDNQDREHPSTRRPRFGIKQIDSKRALKGFTACFKPDQNDLIPEDSTTGKPEKGYKFRGHFLDARTLIFALTDQSHSLESACEDFGVQNSKTKVARHGEITEEYIDYNRRDVLATAELTLKLFEEYKRHPIKLQATKAYSPASIGKAYLHAMRIAPILERQPNFPRKVLGYTQSAFFGGRASAHIRKVPVPVVYVDFLSMYPTVNSLMNLWRFVIADEIKIVTDCKRQIRAFLKRLTRDELFKPETWTNLSAFVKITPNDDILPSRSRYSVQTNDWQVAVNHLTAKGSKPSDGLWYSLPDVVASFLLTGKMPRIVDAFRLEAHGVLENLKAVKLRSVVRVGPRKQDFFRVAIEERKRASSRNDLSVTEKKRLDKALKVLANAASYGIYAEMNRQESDQKVRVKCYGIDAKPFSCSVSHPDVPGEYCFPPLASLITGAARLMLALLEACVSELGGTYAMEDTDSMAIVATKRGGLVPCLGGSMRIRNKEAIQALSWIQVREISDRFSALNPYKKNAIPGSVLKIEEDNFDPQTQKQRQLYCLAISAKRYALFLKNLKGEPILLEHGVNNSKDRWSELGLGHLLNPGNPESEDRDWIGEAWLAFIRRSLGLGTQRHSFEALPAIGRVTLSSPLVMHSFDAFNTGRSYAAQIKPFNFLLTCHVAPLGHPVGCEPEHFHLIAPFELNSRKWLRMDWLNLYAGKRYRITTVGHHGTRHAARVKTYGDVLSEYEFHPESKCADADGQTCVRETVGLLQRRHVQIDGIKYIGKESNQLENVHAGLIHSEKSVYTEYRDARRDEWKTKLLPALRAIPLNMLMKKCRGRLSRRALIDLRAGRSRPHLRNEKHLATLLRMAILT